jgi:hypothetical protein
MSKPICSSCLLPKGVLDCECCQAIQCKNCIQNLPKDSFSFLNPVPQELTHRKYCGRCYDEKVAPALQAYEECMVRAKNVNVFFKTQSEETRLMRRAEKPIRVMDCTDRDETILRLAFMAAEAKFNTLIDVEVTAEKLRNKGYQTTKWHGVGVPTHWDEPKERTP